MTTKTKTPVTAKPTIPNDGPTNQDTKSDAITKYITNINAMSKSTARAYDFRLQQFARFTSKEYNTTVDNLVNQITEGSQVPYDVSGFIYYLQNNNNISNLTLKQWVVTAKNFLEYHDIDISPRRFKLKVKLPKVVKKEKEALDKEDIIEIINACSYIRLKTYVMLLAYIRKSGTILKRLHLNLDVL